jgi:hypothetical protein
METARVWTTDVDNADEAVDFFVIVSQWLSHGQDRLPGMDIYLQCPHKDPMAFYRACGFLRINLQDTTGIEFLPKTIADTLCNKNAQGFVWIVPESKEHCISNPSDATLFWFPIEHSQGGCAGWWFWLPSEQC